MNELVVATRNQGKIAELQRLLVEHAPTLRLRSVSEFDVADVEETGTTFEENALLKAQTIASLTGLPALADDSGIAIDALNGAPGVFSARWAGKHGDDAANIGGAVHNGNLVVTGRPNLLVVSGVWALVC